MLLLSGQIAFETECIRNSKNRKAIALRSLAWEEVVNPESDHRINDGPCPHKKLNGHLWAVNCSLLQIVFTSMDGQLSRHHTELWAPNCERLNVTTKMTGYQNTHRCAFKSRSNFPAGIDEHTAYTVRIVQV